MHDYGDKANVFGVRSQLRKYYANFGAEDTLNSMYECGDKRAAFEIQLWVRLRCLVASSKVKRALQPHVYFSSTRVTVLEDFRTCCCLPREDAFGSG